MTDKELLDLSDEQLLNKLESAEMFLEVLESGNWKIFQEAWRRIHDEADRRLSTLDPTNATAIMQAQYAKRFYSNILQTTIQQMHEMSEMAYAQAKERGLLNHFVEKVRARLSLYKSRG
jgi:type IV secretory pathway VirB4 component